MAYNYQQGLFEAVNPGKLMGRQPTYRSGWELFFMRFLDNHPSVIRWASEFKKIPYRNPITGKQSVYVPDFFIVYEDKTGKRFAEVVEIKPSSQILGKAKGRYDQNAAVVNQAKWEAAGAWCDRNGLIFRIMTEDDLYNKSPKPKARRGPRKATKPHAAVKRPKRPNARKRTARRAR